LNMNVILARKDPWKLEEDPCEEGSLEEDPCEEKDCFPVTCRLPARR
jgi:hypothetical protein